MTTKQVFKGKVLTRTKVKNNILSIYDQATNEDKHDWYKEANSFAVELSNKYNLGIDQVCGIISAVSPMMQWTTNKKVAELCCQVDDHMKVNCMKANSKKAMLIKETKNEAEIMDILKGNKVTSFYLNIRYPDQALSVTIDRHALSIALGQWITEDQYRSMTALQYEFFEQCYRWTAQSININPLLLQSSTWVVWRKIKNNYK